MAVLYYTCALTKHLCDLKVDYTKYDITKIFKQVKKAPKPISKSSFSFKKPTAIQLNVR